MGNCCRSQSSTSVWAGEDWGSFTSKHGRGRGTEKQWLLEAKKLAASSAAATGEVKIKMTKRELEDLVKKLEMEGLSLEEVLGRMMNGEDEFEVEHRRSWMPSLYSIPEDCWKFERSIWYLCIWFVKRKIRKGNLFILFAQKLIVCKFFVFFASFVNVRTYLHLLKKLQKCTWRLNINSHFGFKIYSISISLSIPC